MLVITCLSLYSCHSCLLVFNARLCFTINLQHANLSQQIFSIYSYLGVEAYSSLIANLWPVWYHHSDIDTDRASMLLVWLRLLYATVTARHICRCSRLGMGTELDISVSHDRTGRRLPPWLELGLLHPLQCGDPLMVLISLPRQNSTTQRQQWPSNLGGTILLSYLDRRSQRDKTSVHRTTTVPEGV